MSYFFTIHGQGHSTYWHFGQNAGIKFEQNGPEHLSNSSIFAAEGSTSISDKDGNLILYGTGEVLNNGKVWDVSNQVMPNGTDLKANSSSTQGLTAVIHPNPDSSHLVYLFGLTQETQGGIYSDLYFSVVDINLNGGLGDIIPTRKNLLLDTSLCEKLTIVDRCDGQGFWIIVHAINTSEYRTYSLNYNGLSTSSINSNGIINNALNRRGYLKGSPNGKFLCSAIFGESKIELVKFDANTGSVYDPLLINIPGLNGSNASLPYGIEFSTSNEYVYVSGYIGGISKGYIYQLNLENYTQSNIESSLDTIGKSAKIIGPLQLGSDFKIYSLGIDSLHCIHKPNNFGVNADFELSYLDLGPGVGAEGLPQFPYSYLYQPISTDTICLNDTLKLSFDDSCHLSVFWNFDDPASGSSNTSTLNNTAHVFSDTGVFNVSLAVAYSADTHYYENDIVVRSAAPSNPLQDSIINCDGSPVHIDLSDPQLEFVWSNGSDSGGISVSQSQNIAVTISSFCETVIDSSIVIIDTVPLVSLYAPTLLCEGDSAVVSATNNTLHANLLWSNQDTTGFVKVLDTIHGMDTTIWVVVENACGVATDTVSTQFIKLPDASWFSDSILCEQGDLQILEPTLDGQSHTMTVTNNLVIGDTLTKPWIIDTTGLYYLHAYNVCDTVTKRAFLSPYQRIIVELGADTNICDGDSLILDASWPGSTYLWSSGQTDSAIIVSAEDNYVVTVTNPPCQHIEQRLVTKNLDACDTTKCKFDIANVFTPNADGINDQLKISNLCTEVDFDVSIYNRWGQLVYSTGNYHTSQAFWDGFIHGQAAPAGTYYVVVEYNEGKSHRSSVSLLR